MISVRRFVDIDSAASLGYTPAWARDKAVVGPVKRQGFRRPDAQVEEPLRRPLYCGRCYARMPDRDVGVTCPDCRGAVELRP